jgi:TatD DNase family protein
MLTDTHTHLHFEQYAADLTEVVERARSTGVEKILTLGTELPSCQQAIQIARKFESVYAAVGIHPTDILRCQPDDISLIKDLASAGNKVVAIGEIGLDLYWKEVPLLQQLPVFAKMLEIANDLELPVVIHNRNAHPEMRSFFEQQGIDLLKGVMHSFSGSAEDAQFYLSKGLHISFTGVITFKNYSELEVVKSVPVSRLLLETDSPFLTPVPKRGKRNEPAFVQYVAQKLAEIHGIDLLDIKEITRSNAQKLFGW